MVRRSNSEEHDGVAVSMDEQELKQLLHIFNTVYQFVHNNRQAPGHVIAHVAMVRFSNLLKARGVKRISPGDGDEWPDEIDEQWEALK